MRGGRVTSVEEVIDLVRGSIEPLTPKEVGERLDIHWQTAWWKLEGGVHRGILIRCEYDEDGFRLTQPNHRYILDAM